MVRLQGVSYAHPNKDLLFNNLHFTVAKHDKIALIGNNGQGKSTLLQVIAGRLPISSGTLNTSARPYYVPQLFGQLNKLTIAEALGIDKKLSALRHILDGRLDEENLAILDDDWTIEDRCRQALSSWKLDGLDFNQKMGRLSGGEKTRVFLAGIAICEPDLILLDEPSNHLDREGRQVLYDFVQSSSATMIIVSHDRNLLNLPNVVYELSNGQIRVFGGNYDFYVLQKEIESAALLQDLKATEKELRKAKEMERESARRQQKLDARGKRKQEKAGVPTIMMNTLRNNAERSSSRLKGVHEEKVGSIAQELDELRKSVPDADTMKLAPSKTNLHRGKILFTGKGLNHQYVQDWLWKQPLDLTILSGERIALKGSNGSGKTTLIEMILGNITPVSGLAEIFYKGAIYIDQEYSLLHDKLTVYEQASRFNDGALQEHEIMIRLTHFLFTKEFWQKPSAALSGGEKMRLTLCCLTISNHTPDIIILDEPTNNLDIQNVEMLTNSLAGYEGTLLVVSHDDYFLSRLSISRSLDL